MDRVLCAGFVCGDLVLKPVDDLPPPGGNRFVDHADLTISGCAASAAVAFARLLRPEGGRVAVDLFLPNLAEARAALGDGDLETLLARSLASGVRLMGIKLGENGCVLATAAKRARLPAFDVPVADTCGAGDAWSAAVVYGWRKGWPLATVARFANAAGALCVQQIGATAGLAEASTIRQFAASGRLRDRL